MIGPVTGAETEGPRRQYLAFRLAGRLYALPAEEVGEVIRLPEIARVPQSPPGLLGLANLRGTVIPVASGRGLLGQDKGMRTDRAVVLEQEPPVAVAIDAIEGLVQVAEASVGSNAAKMALLPGEALRGAFQRSSGDVVKILDIRPLLAAAFTPRAPKGFTSRTGAAQPLVQSASVALTKLLTFEVAGQEYALPLDRVQEVAEAPHFMTSVPHTGSVVLGVIGFREMLLPLLSLRGLLGLAEGQIGNQKIVVTHVRGRPVGLVADRMTGIEAAPDIDIEDMPEILAARVHGESRIRAIYRAEKGRRLIPILGTDELFGDEVMNKLEAAREAAPALQQAPATEATIQFVVFRLAKEEFGLPIEAVEEVLGLPEQIARVPKAPKFLEGVINLRGEVLPVVEQRRRFGLPIDEQLTTRRLIVVRTGGQRAGLIVDSVSDVLRAPASEIAPAPSLTGEQNSLLRGVVVLGDRGRLILLLDPAEVLTRAEQGLLAKFARHATEQQQT